MEPTVLAANTLDFDRIPDGFKAQPVVAVILPSVHYIAMMEDQEKRSFNYHLLQHPSYSLAQPFRFDADAFVQQCIEYCREKRVDSVMAFDCFPTLLASIVNQELSLPGPSFQSVFLCLSKYYMRRELTPEVPVTVTTGEQPTSSPVVLKAGDTQFYVGTRLVPRAEQWQGVWDEMSGNLLLEGVERRQQFYLKWATKFGWAQEYGWKVASDVKMVHIEPLFPNVAEYQMEVVVLPDGTPKIADTGNIEHGPQGQATVFRTPATVTLTPVLREFLKGVVDKLVAKGYKGAAMDIEFLRLAGDKERYQLVEVNSRYSYMGNYIHFGHCARAKQSAAAITAQRSEQGKEVRNLVNRTRLSLAAPPLTLPCKDDIGKSKICAMIFTDIKGNLSDFFDTNAVNAMIEEQFIDAWIPKPVFLKGEVTDTDLVQYAGYAKVGCFNVTMFDADLPALNAKLAQVARRFFYGKDTGFLPIKVVDKDGDAPTNLHPDALNESDVPNPSAPCCECCVQ